MQNILESVSGSPSAPFIRSAGKLPVDSVDLSCGVCILDAFPDPEKLLDTAYDDLARTLARWKVSQSGAFSISTELDRALESEEFILETTPEACRIYAAGCEGIRRGLYELSGSLSRANAPFLKIGQIRREFFIKDRISRSFFAPIHRPPFNKDELLDDIDYYPEAFLNRLAQEGINRLWLTVEFHEVTCSSIQALEPETPRRLQKLRGIVEKCRRYGIRVYLFCLEPAGFFGESELASKYPELLGVDCSYSMHAFCPDSPLAQQHLFEQTFYLFSEVSHLAGLINIPAGEALASCFSSCGSPCQAPAPFRCPRCGSLQPWQALNRSLEPMIRGMRAANPEAVFHCWLYQPSGGASLHAWVEDCARHLPDGASLIYNFESGISVKQQGRTRTGGDYWQSKTGPSPRFLRMAELRHEVGGTFGAKLQVCNAFEVSTVPNLPVPGILFRKYRILKQTGTRIALYGWYFGTSPGFMHRFALRLASADFKKGERAFLLEAARAEWGTDAEKVAAAWALFARGYACYPVNDGIQYDGPFHHGIAWPLLIEAELRDLFPVWQPARISGDSIGACLAEFPLADAEKQCRKMAQLWNHGLELFLPLKNKYWNYPERLEDIRMAEAAGLLLTSGWRILRFYLLRRRMYGGRFSALDEMEEIVRQEVCSSRRMIALCREDARLGYQSEAQVHKFDPALLRCRIDQLNGLLKNGIPNLRVRLLKGGKPLYANAVRQSCCRADGSNHQQKTFCWSIRRVLEGLRIRFQCRLLLGNDQVSDLVYIILADRLCSEFPILIRCTKTGTSNSKRTFSPKDCSLFQDDHSWGMDLVVPVTLIRDNPVAFNIQRQYMQVEQGSRKVSSTSTYAAMMECQFGNATQIDSWSPEAAPVALSPYIHPAGWGLLQL